MQTQHNNDSAYYRTNQQQFTNNNRPQPQYNNQQQQHNQYQQQQYQQDNTANAQYFIVQQQVAAAKAKHDEQEIQSVGRHAALVARQLAFELASTARMNEIETKMGQPNAMQVIRELQYHIQSQRIDQLEAHICRIKGVATQAQLMQMNDEATAYKKDMMAGVFDHEEQSRKAHAAEMDEAELVAIDASNDGVEGELSPSRVYSPSNPSY